MTFLNILRDFIELKKLRDRKSWRIHTFVFIWVQCDIFVYCFGINTVIWISISWRYWRDGIELKLNILRIRTQKSDPIKWSEIKEQARLRLRVFWVSDTYKPIANVKQIVKQIQRQTSILSGACVKAEIPSQIISSISLNYWE